MLVQDYLRRHVCLCTFLSSEIPLCATYDLGQTKINKFYLVFVIDQNVVRFDISVAYLIIVAVVDRLQYSSHYMADFMLIKKPMSFDFIIDSI